MKLRTTLALLVIAIGLGLFVWILDRRSLGTREREARRAYLVDLDRNDVTQLEIENGDTKTRLMKTSDGWKLSAPVVDRADPKVIDTLLYSTQFLKRDDTITNLGRGDQKRNYLKQFGVPDLISSCDAAGNKPRSSSNSASKQLWKALATFGSTRKIRFS